MRPHTQTLHAHAHVHALVERHALRRPRVIELNGMRFSENPQRVYHALLEQMGSDHSAAQIQRMTAAAAQSEIEQILLAPRGAGRERTMHLVVLDELDGLLAGRDQKILYKLFEWPRMAKSSLIFIGVANSMDLTEKFLPHLKAHRCEPELLIYAPYTDAQISRIVGLRFANAYRAAHRGDNERDDAAEMRYIEPAALSLCAKKVASASGDLRKGFELCRKALEVRRETLLEAGLVRRSLGGFGGGFGMRSNVERVPLGAGDSYLVQFSDMQRAIKALMASPIGTLCCIVFVEFPWTPP